MAINHLFNGFKVVIMDHHMGGTNKKCNVDLFDRVIRRLQFEHRLDDLIKNKKIEINQHKLTIALL